MEVLLLLLLVFVGVIAAGSICGIVALNRIGTIETRLGQLETRLHSLDVAPEKVVSPTPPPVAKRVEEAVVAPCRTSVPATEPSPPEPEPTAPELTEEPAIPEPPKPEPVEEPATATSKFNVPKLDEITLGTKWLVWVGVVMTLIGTALFLKYAYDNDFVQERGRLAIGVVAGIVALGFGEHFRRKDWRVLFHALTGGGIATFYVCVYFSFQVYGFSGQTVSMALATVVTLLAVVTAVGHNAIGIAILGVIGGFLSPILLSTGENNPYGLFTYIVILDLVAMGAAYYRRWRALDVFCFACTVLIFQAWRLKFYVVDELPPEQFNHELFYPALIFASVFYAMFLVIPTLHSLVRRTDGEVEDLVLLAANTLVSLFCYYHILFDDYRRILGFVVLGQAALVFLLFQAWSARIGARNRTADGLLIISLGLITLVIPIELKLYILAIAWAVEGVVVVYLGVRFRNIICKAGGCLALVLAVCGLLARLPLHDATFTPVFNVAFGSWAAVIAAAVAAAYLLHRMNPKPHLYEPFLAAGTFLLGFVLGCALLTMEVTYYWTIGQAEHYEQYLFNSLAVLWAVITAAVATVVGQKRLDKWLPLVAGCYLAGVLVFVIGLTHYRLPDYRMLFNVSFAARLLLALSFWWGASRLVRIKTELPVSPRQIAAGMFLAGFAMLCTLLTIDVAQYWTTAGIENYAATLFNSLAVLWALIAGAVAVVIGRKRLDLWVPLAGVCYAVAGIVFTLGLLWYETPSTWLMVNWTFAARLLIPVSLWLGAAALARIKDQSIKDAVATVGHILLSVLLAFEFYTWAKSTQAVNEHMGISLISAAWAVQAFVLIWLGLAMQNRNHRILGFVLFGVTIAKVFAVDTSTLEPVYRIVSFIVIGPAAIAAGYFYQRYLPRLLGDTREET